jgi:hypothetical protein
MLARLRVSIAVAALDVLGQLAEMRITRRQLGPGIAYADDRFALEFMIRNALVLHPAPVHETILVRSAKPFRRT